jgi:hypothetical protein
MITEKKREDKCLKPAKARAILSGKTFYEYENYEIVFQASIFMPFLIIFITQIIIKYISYIENNLNKPFFVFSTIIFFVAFIAFSYIIYEIIEARHNKKYNILSLSIALIVFLFVSTIALYMGSNEEYKFNWLWFGIPLLLMVSVWFSVNNNNHIGCKIEIKQYILATCSLATLSISIIYIFSHQFYNTLLIFPIVLFTFYFLNIYLHNELLKLLQENDKNIDIFRELQTGASMEGGHYSGHRDF